MINYIKASDTDMVMKNINKVVSTKNLWLTGLQLNCLHYNRGCDWLNEDFIKWNTEFVEKWVEF